MYDIVIPYAETHWQANIDSQKNRYTFFNEKIKLYGQPAGFDEFDTHPRGILTQPSGILTQPLLYEPGTYWSYGVRNPHPLRSTIL